MLSCQPTEVSQEGLATDFPESVFTHFLVKGLEGDPDALAEGTRNVTFDSLMEYVQGHVSSYVSSRFNASQVPDGRATLGRMVLARADGAVPDVVVPPALVTPPVISPPLPSADKNLPPLSRIGTGDKDWHFLLSGTAQGKASQDGNALKVNVTNADGTIWQAQVTCGASLENGRVYELHFRVKSDVPVWLIAHNSPISRGRDNTDFQETHGYMELTPQWKTYSWRFIPHTTGDDPHILPVRFCGVQPGSVWLSDVALEPLATGSSLVPPVTDTDSWYATQWGKDAAGQWHEGMGGQMALTVEGNALKIVNTEEHSSYSRGSWAALAGHMQLTENTTYTIRFRAKAEPPRKLTVLGESEGNNPPPVFDGRDVQVGADWQWYDVTVTTKPGMSGAAYAPEFEVTPVNGALWLSDVSVVEGGG